MNKRNIVIILLLTIFFSASILYWFNFGTSIVVLREVLYLATSLIAVVAGILALRSYGLHGPKTLTLILLTAGISYWFVGDMLFDYYQYILQTNPFPSAADIFYTLAYPMLFFGLINEIRIAQVNWKQLNKATIFLFVFASICLAAIVFYFGILQAYQIKESLFTNIVAMGYGAGDLLLILASMMVLILAWEFRGGSLSRVWLSIFISFLFTLIADILYAIYTNQYNNETGIYKNVIDAFFMIAYLIYAFALFEFRFSITGAYQRIASLKLEKKDDKGQKVERLE